VLAGDYPISRTLHLLTDGQPTGLALEFIEFILSPEGQSLVADEGFVPLE
jgi:phosphate transport system substrate-binding protein